MTYEQFKNKYNHKYVDYDGYYGYQCWDLAQFYFTECLGLPASVLSGCGVAKNMLYGEKRKLMDKYFNEVPTNAMYPGDVCIWDCGEAGHIAMFDHWDGSQNWYFSQNPNPSEVINCELPNLHAFRLKAKQEVAPNVERDESKTQIKVIVPNLNVRIEAGRYASSIGFAHEGYYDIYETYNYDGYTWYKIADHQWVAYSPEWIEICPAKQEDEYVKFKVLNKKDGYVEIDLGKVLVKDLTQ